MKVTVGNGVVLKGDLAVCIDAEPWEDYCLEPPCGQLNPTNPILYDILGELYAEMLDVFGNPDIFHMGGDEVSIVCWNKTQQIVNWMHQHNRGTSKRDYEMLWGEFQQSAYIKLTQSLSKTDNITAILSISDLVLNSEFGKQYVPPENYIIEVWDSSVEMTVPNLLDLGYRLIISNSDAWYLDCGFGGWVSGGNNWCSPYKGWQIMYDNSLYKSLNGNWTINDPKKRKLIYGGEVKLWSEEIDMACVESRMWPRASAVAERLWTNPDQSWIAADDRMQWHRARLVARGINAEALQPLWCLQNQGKCTQKNL